MVRLNVPNFEKAQLERRLTKATGTVNDALTARLMGISPSTLWRIKKGLVEPSQDFIAATLCFFKGYSFEYFFLLNDLQVRNDIAGGIGRENPIRGTRVP